MGLFSGIVDALFGGDEAPAPDPLIGQSAKLSAEVGKAALDFYKQAYYHDIRPRQQRLDRLTERAAGLQIEDARRASEFSEEQRDDYREVYRPMERRVASESANFDSEENIGRRMGIASSSVADAATAARENSVRELKRYGINPNSGAFAALNSRLASQEMLAQAGARTGSAFDTIDRGMALRTGVVQTGRGLVNSAGQTMSGGTQAGSAAMGGTANSAQVGNQGVSTGGQGFGAATQAFGTAGNLLNNQNSNQIRAAGQKQEMTGAVVGAIGTAMGGIFSSKKVKDRNEKLDENLVLEKVKGLNVDGWSYKGDGQRHIGPYAEELHQKFGVGDGTTIGPTDTGGIALSAVKALANKMEAIEQAVGLRTQPPQEKQQQPRRGLEVR